MTVNGSLTGKFGENENGNETSSVRVIMGM